MSKPYENQYEQHYYCCNKHYKNILNQITVNVTKFAEHGFSVDWFSTSHVHALLSDSVHSTWLDDQHSSH